MAAPPIPAEQAALLAAIVAEPDDDTPRLAYADWLQEQGYVEQAQFIRDSIKLAGMRPRASQYRPLAQRLAKVAEVNGRQWLKVLGLEYASDPEFERGLPKGVTYWRPGDFVTEAPTLFARLPIRDLAVCWQSGKGLDNKVLGAMAAMPELARLHTLGLANSTLSIPLAGWKKLIGSRHLRRLRRLCVYSCVEDKHVLALAACRNLVGLTSLDLYENPIEVSSILAVLRSPHLAKVKTMSFHETDAVDVCRDNDPELYKELIAALTKRLGSAKAAREALE
jgi:uncharacterized protein (TIGR02996 family)